MSSFKSSFLIFFPLIGFSFMFVEMVLIQKLSLFLGHSSYSVSMVFSTLLCFSGLGSLYMSKTKGCHRKKLMTGAFLISILTFSTVFFSEELLSSAARIGELSFLLLWFSVLFFCGLIGFFMGWFFAPGLSLLEKLNKQSLPAAWSLNGFASVAASPLAVMLSISFGFLLPLALAFVFYLAAAVLFTCHRRLLDV